MKAILPFLLLLIAVSSVKSRVWVVGPECEYKFCSEVAPFVEDNDTVFIELGVYENDEQVTWRKNNLYISGINGHPSLVAGEKIATDSSNGKGIFVIQGQNTTVENIDFYNSRVPDHNGAGIRQEGAGLTLRHCLFYDNEMGILCGSIPNCTILIEYCDFRNSGSSSNPGYQHNVYINHVDTLIFRYNYTANAIAEGHELKSRASNNFIEFNRIMNLTSQDSRNIDLPNGGTAVIVGNIIVQSNYSVNNNIIAFGSEGLTNPGPHNIWLASNTIVNYKNKGNMLDVAGIDTLFLKNNIMVGSKSDSIILGIYATLDSANNIVSPYVENACFVKKATYDYDLEEYSPAVDSGEIVYKSIKGHSLNPAFEPLCYYDFHERINQGKIDIGSKEYHSTYSIYEPEDIVITIYPNPATDKVMIRSKCGDTKYFENIEIYNALGECVILQHVPFNSNGELNLDISSLISGVWYLKISNNFFKFLVYR